MKDVFRVSIYFGYHSMYQLFFIFSANSSILAWIACIVFENSTSSFPVGSFNPQSSLYWHGIIGQFTLHPIVITISTGGISDSNLTTAGIMNTYKSYFRFFHYKLPTFRCFIILSTILSLLLPSILFHKILLLRQSLMPV